MIDHEMRKRIHEGVGTWEDAKALLLELEERERVAANQHIGFRGELAAVINKYSREEASNTPDFVLAEFIDNALFAFNVAVNAREHWYEREASPDHLPDKD